MTSVPVFPGEKKKEKKAATQCVPLCLGISKETYTHSQDHLECSWANLSVESVPPSIIFGKC